MDGWDIGWDRRPEVQSQPRTLETKRMKRKYQRGREQKRKGRREWVRREKAILKTTVDLLSGCSKASMTLLAFKERSLLFSICAWTLPPLSPGCFPCFCLYLLPPLPNDFHFWNGVHLPSDPEPYRDSSTTVYHTPMPLQDLVWRTEFRSPTNLCSSLP